MSCMSVCCITKRILVQSAKTNNRKKVLGGFSGWWASPLRRYPRLLYVSDSTVFHFYACFSVGVGEHYDAAARISNLGLTKFMIVYNNHNHTHRHNVHHSIHQHHSFQPNVRYANSIVSLLMLLCPSINCTLKRCFLLLI